MTDFFFFSIKLRLLYKRNILCNFFPLMLNRVDFIFNAEVNMNGANGPVGTPQEISTPGTQEFDTVTRLESGISF